MAERDSTGPQPTTDTVSPAPPGSRLWRGQSTEGLTPLAASALLPVTMAVIAGSPVAIALAAVSENAGSRYLTLAIDRVASRLRRESAQPPAPETVQVALVGEIRALVEGDQLVARVLVPELAEIMRCTGVLETDPPTSPVDPEADLDPDPEAGALP